MKKFFEKNNRFDKLTTRIFIAIVVGALIIGAAVYFGLKNGAEKKNDVYVSNSSDQCLAPADVLVTKVIDGDTIVVEGGEHIRLLGMDADESGYPCYEDAKTRLEELVLNKKIRLEKDITDVDQYKRCLRYVFLGEQNIALELVKEGLAIARFYEPDVKYKEEIILAEKTAVDNKVGCKWSGLVKDSADKSSNGKTEFFWEDLTKEKTGLEVVGACNAGNYYEKEAIVEGKIVDAYRSKTNTVFLNFEKSYPNHCFTGVIFSSDQYKFVQNLEDYYLNKNVRIRGEVKEYQGKPEIIFKNPSQIEIGK